MSKQHVLSPRSEKFDPAKTVITFSWTVDEDGQVVDAASTPPLHNLSEGIQGLCDENSVTLVPGAYRFLSNADGLQEPTLPKTLVAADRERLVSLLSTFFGREIPILQTMLESMPNDEEILAAAPRVVTAVILGRSVLASQGDDRQNGMVNVPAELELGTIRGACPSHSINNVVPKEGVPMEQVEALPPQLAVAFGFAKIIQNPHILIGSKGAFVLIPGEENETLLVAGFVACGQSIFHDYLNDLFTNRLQEAIGLVAQDVLDEMRQTTSTYEKVWQSTFPHAAA